MNPNIIPPPKLVEITTTTTVDNSNICNIHCKLQVDKLKQCIDNASLNNRHPNNINNTNNSNNDNNDDNVKVEQNQQLVKCFPFIKEWKECCELTKGKFGVTE